MFKKGRGDLKTNKFGLYEVRKDRWLLYIYVVIDQGSKREQVTRIRIARNKKNQFEMLNLYNCFCDAFDFFP